MQPGTYAQAIAAASDGALLVAATDHKLLAHNDSRAGFIISADVADVWVSYGAGAAVVQKGHCVRAGGVPFVEHRWPGEVHVISTGAAKVGVTELKFAVGDDEGEQPTGADLFTPQGPSDAAIPAPTALPPGTPIY